MASYKRPLKTCRCSVLSALPADLPNVNVIYHLLLFNAVIVTYRGHKYQTQTLKRTTKQKKHDRAVYLHEMIDERGMQPLKAWGKMQQASLGASLVLQITKLLSLK